MFLDYPGAENIHHYQN